MTEPRPKPVYGMRNELHTKLEYIRRELDEAKEAAESALCKVDLATKAIHELLSEDGEIFHRARCQSCRTSWLDERASAKVTHCPSCGKKV